MERRVLSSCEMFNFFPSKWNVCYRVIGLRLISVLQLSYLIFNRFRWISFHARSSHRFTALSNCVLFCPEWHLRSWHSDSNIYNWSVCSKIEVNGTKQVKADKYENLQRMMCCGVLCHHYLSVTWVAVFVTWSRSLERSAPQFVVLRRLQIDTDVPILTGTQTTFSLLVNEYHYSEPHTCALTPLRKVWQ